jgi:hypothetical protein
LADRRLPGRRGPAPEVALVDRPASHSASPVLPRRTVGRLGRVAGQAVPTVIISPGEGVAPTGLQNQGTDDATPCLPKRLRKSTPSVAAHWQRAAQTDPDLAAVIDAWDRLPEAVRAGIVAMVKAASKR